ncbi:MAG TPA: response regulator, partial [Nitrospirae bacterium]|nr:response regulator [Nitrospirota bacterium]
MGRILIVDDEELALENLEYAMKKEGYEVVCANNGSMAFKNLEKQEFDVVMTDLRMDKVDGIQVLTRCRSLYPDSEVIIITAYASLPSAIE